MQYPWAQVPLDQSELGCHSGGQGGEHSAGQQGGRDPCHEQVPARPVGRVLGRAHAEGRIVPVCLVHP